MIEHDTKFHVSNGPKLLPYHVPGISVGNPELSGGSVVNPELSGGSVVNPELSGGSVVNPELGSVVNPEPIVNPGLKYSAKTSRLHATSIFILLATVYNN